MTDQTDAETVERVAIAALPSTPVSAADVEAAVLAEREACAKICDGEAEAARLHNCATEAIGAVWSAKSIRARSTEGNTP